MKGHIFYVALFAIFSIRSSWSFPGCGIDGINWDCVASCGRDYSSPAKCSCFENCLPSSNRHCDYYELPSNGEVVLWSEYEIANHPSANDGQWNGEDCYVHTEEWGYNDSSSIVSGGDVECESGYYPVYGYYEDSLTKGDISESEWMALTRRYGILTQLDVYCMPCQTGQSCSGGELVACGSGYYKTMSSYQNEYGFEYGNWTCLACPTNSTSTAGSTSCTCNANYYGNGTTSCTACPDGGTSAAGSTSQTACSVTCSAYLGTSDDIGTFTTTGSGVWAN